MSWIKVFFILCFYTVTPILHMMQSVAEKENEFELESNYCSLWDGILCLLENICLTGNVLNYVAFILTYSASILYVLKTFNNLPVWHLQDVQWLMVAKFLERSWELNWRIPSSVPFCPFLDRVAASFVAGTLGNDCPMDFGIGICLSPMSVPTQTKKTFFLGCNDTINVLVVDIIFLNLNYYLTFL